MDMIAGTFGHFKSPVLALAIGSIAIKSSQKLLLKPCPFLIRYLKVLALSFFPLLTYSYPGSDGDIVFTNFSEGISNGSVTCILEDSKGYLWVGTENGLNRFDGVQFKSYEARRNDSRSLTNSWIQSLYEDEDNNIWVGTYGGGISIYNRSTDDFRPFSSATPLFDISDKSIYCMFEDSSKQLWIATNDGVHVLDIDERKFKKHFIEGETVRSIYEDEEGVIWIGSATLSVFLNEETGIVESSDTSYFEKTLQVDRAVAITADKEGRLWLGDKGKGLFHIFKKGGKYAYERYEYAKSDPGSLSSNKVISLCADSKGYLWVGTENAGLNRMNPVKKEFERFCHDSESSTSLSNNSVWSIMEDHFGRIWVGTFSMGLDVIDPFSKNFGNHYGAIADNKIDDIVEGAVETEDGKLWVVTDGNGIHVFDAEKGKVAHMVNDLNNMNSIASNAVVSVTKYLDDFLLFSTWGGGVSMYDLNDHNFSHFQYNPNDDRSLLNNQTRNIIIDKYDRRNFWVATWGGGLNRYLHSTKGFERYLWGDSEEDDFLLSSDRVSDMVFDADGNLWIATTDGLNMMLFDSSGKVKQVRSYSYDKNDLKSLSNNSLNFVYLDEKDNIWIGTNSAGMNVYNAEEDNFTHFTKDDGLPSNSVVSMLEDDLGNYWFGTKKGISKATPAYDSTGDILSMSFVNYDKSDGLEGDFMKIGAALKTKDNGMLFGGVGGFNFFYPDSIKDNPNIPPVYISEIHLLNDDKYLKGVEEWVSMDKTTKTKRLDLEYTQNTLTFNYVALNYTNPLKNQYAYMLEGVDKAWNYVGTKRSATYTTLSPGTYAFKVKASNNDKVWNESGASLMIKIWPPYWQTTWFKTLLAICSLVLVLSIIQLRTRSISRKKDELERHVLERTKALRNEIDIRKKTESELQEAKKKAEDANIAKSEFLANMSHEIRTPMNGILGMTELALEANPNKRQKDYLNIVMHSGEALVNIINDILDLSKIEAGKLQIDRESFNVHKLTENVVTPFSVLASQKGVELLFEIRPSVPVFLLGDPVRIRQVMINLVGNAIKFTSKGEILISIDAEKVENSVNKGEGIMLHIAVKDTGIGIEGDKLQSIFESFSQVDASITKKYGGTGLGLTISKKLVDLMNGDIKVKSKIGEGSTFSFSIPMSLGTEVKPIESPEINILKGKNVLIVDDNRTNCILLQGNLDQWEMQSDICYGIDEAKKMLEENKYDLLLLDHHLNGKIGLDLALEIKNDVSMHDIKIILLSSITDLSGIPDLIKENTISDYLQKPIRGEQLRNVVLNTVAMSPKNNKTKGTKHNDLLVSESKKYSSKILLAEDNEINQKVFVQMLKKHNNNIDIANNGFEALSALEKKEYDIIFMDIQMPHLDGIQVTQKVRASNGPNKNKPIVAITAYAMKSDLERCFAAGMDGHVSKPVKKADLLGALDQFEKDK